MSMQKGYPSSQKRGDQKYGTLQPLGSGKHGIDVLPKAMSALLLIDQIPEVTSSFDYIDLAGHIVQAGDMIRFTGGVLDRQEVAVSRIDGNRIYLSHKFSAEITPADVFLPLRAVTLTISKEGNLSTSSGPTQFVLDGAAQQVIEDTITPANNAPLPVKLTGVTGDINITANDLNVQLNHVGVSADSTRIGDGVTELGIIPVTKEAKVSDANALAELLLIKAALLVVNTPSVMASYFSSSIAVPNGGRTAVLVTVPALKIGTELEIFCKNGETFSAYTLAVGGDLIGKFTNGGGKINTNLVAATGIFLESDSPTFTASDLVINLTGVDA